MTDALDLSVLPSMEEQGRDRFKCLLHGGPGTGKTTLAGSIGELGKTLLISLPGEPGLSSLQGVPYAANIIPFRPKTVGEMDDVLWKFVDGDHDFESVIVERVDSWHQAYVRFYDGLEESGPRQKRRGKGAPKKRDGRQLYGDANDALKDDMTFWFGLADADNDKPVHVVMTSQSRERESRKDSGDWRLGPDVSPGALRTVEAAPDFIGYCAIERKGGGEISFTDEEVSSDDFVRTVRFGPHDEIMTKTHESIEATTRWPDVVGADGKRLTLPKMMRFLKLI